MAEQQRPRRVGRPQSEYKTQFLQVDLGNGIIKWQCRFCTMQYGTKTGTANFKRHLVNNHPKCFIGNVLVHPFSEEFDTMSPSSSSSREESESPTGRIFYNCVSYTPPVPVPVLPDTHRCIWSEQSPPVSASPSFSFPTPAVGTPPTFGPFSPSPDPPSASMSMIRPRSPWHPNWSSSPSPRLIDPPPEQLTTDSYGHLQWLQQQPTTSSFSTVALAPPPREVDQGSPLKRKLTLDLEDDGGDLELFTPATIETLLRQGFSRSEILEQMLGMTVRNPMYLHAFLNDNMHDFFSLACNPHFPSLSLGLIDDALLRRKRESLKALLREYCDTRWSPLLFDVFVFPLLLGDGDAYAIVELVYLDKKGQRRSCLLDCVPLPQHFPADAADVLGAVIAANLRAFEVDSKLSDCTMWGREYEVANTVLKEKLECRRRGRTDGFWEEEKKKQFFSVLKKTQEEQFYNMQIEVVQCLSCLDQLEEMLKNGTLVKPMRGTCPNYGVDMKTILSDLQTIFEPNVLDPLEWSETPSVQLTEKFLKIVYKKFNTLQRKMKKLSELGGTLKRNLNKISCDRKYAVYYIHKNQKNVNLLHIIPVTSYEDSLKDIYHYLKNFMELLKNPGLDSSYGMDDLVTDMDLIEIEDSPELSCNKDTVYEPKALIENILKIFQDWRKIFQQGVALSREYISLCNYFTGYKNHESNIQSRYAKEFCDVARSAPPHLSPEKWMKVAFLRSWNKFQSNYE